MTNTSKMPKTLKTPKAPKEPLGAHEPHSAVKSALSYEPLATPLDAEIFTEDNYADHDADNGRRLLDQHKHDLCFIKRRRDNWICWTGNAWEVDLTQTVEQWMEDILRTAVAELVQGYTPRNQLHGRARWLMQSLDTPGIRAALAAASTHVTVKADLFDQHPWLIPCDNGLTYDLSPRAAKVLRPSCREDYMSRCLPVSASAARVAHPRWDAFLNLLMDGDAAMVRYLRQSIGLLLTGDVSEKCFWFGVGDTDTGKTTLLTFLHAFLGGFAYKIPLRALLKRREDMAIRHDLAGLQGARVAYCEEFKTGDVLDEGIMKDITGGGKITADRKHEANIQFNNYAKLIIGTNELPAIADIDEAIRGRVRAVPFTVNIPKRLGKDCKSVQDVVDELLAEAPGILQDLVEAVLDWRAAGGKLEMPPPVAEATRQYLDTQDPLVAWMETCCDAGGKTEERPFAEWVMSFRLQSGRTRGQSTDRWFGGQLEKHQFTKRHTAKGPRYTGPALTDMAAQDMKDAQAEAAQEREAHRMHVTYSASNPAKINVQTP